MEPVASLTHEIKLQTELSASDFSLVAPDGFTAETIAAPTVTEDEMLDYIRAAVAYNENVFPDSLMVAFDSDKLNSQWELDETSRSKAAKDLIEQVNRFRLREIYQPPLERFVNDNTLPDSFQFVGSGAKAGNAEQIIAWYRLKHGKQLRAIFGNLTIREVSDKDLPFIIGR
jgi:hypothetical protein